MPTTRLKSSRSGIAATTSSTSLTLRIPANMKGVTWKASTSRGTVNYTSTQTVSSNSSSTVTITASHGSHSSSSTQTTTVTITYGNTSTSGTVTQNAAGPGTFTVNGIKVAKVNLKSSGVFETSATAYGGYFTWDQAQSACPSGWRLPTKEQWSTIFNNASGSNAWGQSGGWSFSSSAAKHTSGLILPAAGQEGGTHAGSIGYYWSSSESSSSSACYLGFNSSSLYPQNNTSKTIQYSVRCVR